MFKSSNEIEVFRFERSNPNTPIQALNPRNTRPFRESATLPGRSCPRVPTGSLPADVGTPVQCIQGGALQVEPVTRRVEGRSEFAFFASFGAEHRIPVCSSGSVRGLSLPATLRVFIAGGPPRSCIRCSILKYQFRAVY